MNQYHPKQVILLIWPAWANDTGNDVNSSILKWIHTRLVYHMKHSPAHCNVDTLSSSGHFLMLLPSSLQCSFVPLWLCSAFLFAFSYITSSYACIEATFPVITRCNTSLSISGTPLSQLSPAWRYDKCCVGWMYRWHGFWCECLLIQISFRNTQVIGKKFFFHYENRSESLTVWRDDANLIHFVLQCECDCIVVMKIVDARLVEDCLLCSMLTP